MPKAKNGGKINIKVIIDMKGILKFFLFLAAVAAIIITAEYIYRYALNQEVNSWLTKLMQIILNRLNNI